MPRVFKSAKIRRERQQTMKRVFFYFWRILDRNLEVLYLSKTGISRILQKSRGLKKSDSILSSSALSSDLHESRVDHSVVERATGMCNLSGRGKLGSSYFFSPRTERDIYIELTIDAFEIHTVTNTAAPT